MTTNNSESLPNEFGNASENYQSPSENVPNDFGNKPQVSEPLPKKERTDDHTLTVRDVTHIFEQEKISITERTIINWCKPNAKGECRLNCFYDESDYRYYIATKSVQHVLDDVRNKFRKPSEPFWKPSETLEAFSESLPNEFGNDAAPSENIPKRITVISEAKSNISEEPEAAPERHKKPEEDSDKIFQLQAEVMELKIETRAKNYFIDQLKNDRETFRKSFEDERRQFIDLISKQAAQIGEYKEKLLSLDAPKQQHVRDVAEDHSQTPEHEPVRYTNQEEQQY